MSRRARSVEGASSCGFCATGDHDRCPRSYRRFYFEGKRGIRYLDETRVCPCTNPAHEKENDST